MVYLVHEVRGSLHAWLAMRQKQHSEKAWRSQAAQLMAARKAEVSEETQYTTSRFSDYRYTQLYQA